MYAYVRLEARLLKLLSIIVVLAGAGWYLGIEIILKSILAYTTASSADLSQIRARYEGILGEGGPYMRVIDIVYKGGWPAGRSSPARRIYLVRLKRQDGSILGQDAEIPVAIWGRQGMFRVRAGESLLKR